MLKIVLRLVGGVGGVGVGGVGVGGVGVARTNYKSCNDPAQCSEPDLCCVSRLITSQHSIQLDWTKQGQQSARHLFRF